MKIKFKMLLFLVLTFILALPLQASAASYTNYPFTFEFSTQIYTPVFDVTDSIRLDVTSQLKGSGTDPYGGIYMIALQKCTPSPVVCSWTDIQYADSDVVGSVSLYWYGLDGKYRIKFYDETNGLTVKGYGNVKYK